MSASFHGSSFHSAHRRHFFAPSPGYIERWLGGHHLAQLAHLDRTAEAVQLHVQVLLQIRETRDFKKTPLFRRGF